MIKELPHGNNEAFLKGGLGKRDAIQICKVLYEEENNKGGIKDNIRKVRKLNSLISKTLSAT